MEPLRIVIRTARAEDLAAIASIDHAATSGDRAQWLVRYLRPGTDRISLSFVAEAEGPMGGAVAGFVLGGVYRGEFGAVEPLAILEAIGIAPEFRKRGAAHALFSAFARHAERLDVRHIRTLVAWNDLDLLGFFSAMGMHPTGLVPLSVEVSQVPQPPHPDDEDLER